MTRSLIVNADDFGQSDGLTRGVAEAYERGIVTSASLMVMWPATMAAATYARTNPGLSVGLHVDLGEWIQADGTWRVPRGLTGRHPRSFRMSGDTIPHEPAASSVDAAGDHARVTVVGTGEYK